MSRPDKPPESSIDSLAGGPERAIPGEHQYPPRETLDISPKATSVQIRHVNDTHDVELRPLQFAEIQDLLRLARKTGWYANLDLTLFVASRGLVPTSSIQSLQALDVYLVAKLAREVWILTLSELAQLTNRLLAAHGYPKSARARRYSTLSLAKRELLYSLWSEMQVVDTIRVADRLLRLHFRTPRMHNQRPMARGRAKALLRKAQASLADMFAKLIIGEPRLLQRIPNAVASTVHERVYIASGLALTLDWRQFADILWKYNTIVDVLAFHSTQLGGLDTTPRDRALVTGVPLFLESLRDDPRADVAVVSAALNGLLTQLPVSVPRSDRKLLSTEWASTLKQLRTNTSASEDTSPQRQVEQALVEFHRRVSRHAGFTRRLTFHFWGAYASFRDDQAEAHMKQAARAAETNVTPHGYLLVEGESELICYSHFVRLLGGWGLLRVIDCGGDSEVVSIFRRMLREQAPEFPILTLLDSDAGRYHKDLTRIRHGTRPVKHYLCPSGSLEQIFDARLHAEILNERYPGSPRIEAKEIRSRGGGAKALDAILWRSRSVRFDKCDQARRIVDRIRPGSWGIPGWAREVCADGIELARARRDRSRRDRASGVFDLDRNLLLAMGELIERRKARDARSSQ